jgi:hypothetical protein
METLVAQMTKEELIQTIGSVMERKLLELFGDGELSAEAEERLARQQEMVAQGERGHAFDDVVQQLGLA